VFKYEFSVLSAVDAASRGGADDALMTMLQTTTRNRPETQTGILITMAFILTQL
jgi:hypothetical protein